MNEVTKIYYNWNGVPLTEDGTYIDGDKKLLLTLGTMDQFFWLKDYCGVVVCGRFSARELKNISQQETEELLYKLLTKFKYKPKGGDK